MLNWFFGIVTKFFKLIVMVIIILGVVYCGSCVYANFIQGDTGEYKLPSEKQAEFEITIHNTRNVFYTDEYSQEGSRITCRGYWELLDGKYKYRDIELTLDKAIFGEITIRER